jgi:hypothetical protein
MRIQGVKIPLARQARGAKRGRSRYSSARIHTLKRFQRYAKFYIRGSDAETNSICWRVEATDAISMPGILEITAHEYYSND